MTFDEAKEFAWKWSGPDWHEVGRLTHYLFPGNGQCQQLQIILADCDGDFCNWGVENKTTELALRGTEENYDAAWQQVEIAINVFWQEARGELP